MKKSVLEELYDAVFDVEKEKRKNEIEYVIKLCELDNLLENHPYDLSGGEQQRVALAKMLLKNLICWCLMNRQRDLTLL